LDGVDNDRAALSRLTLFGHAFDAAGGRTTVAAEIDGTPDLLAMLAVRNRSVKTVGRFFRGWPG
jgi:hypothetical protein